MRDEATRSAYPFLELLEQNVGAIRSEALAVDPAWWAPMAGYQEGCTGLVLLPGRWAHDFQNADFARNRQHCPVTTNLISTIDGVELGGFMSIAPGGRMKVHTDPRDDHVVRCHLGLRLAKDEQAWWPEGTARLMDTREPHWARNDESYARVTMVIDVRMPFVVAEKQFGPWRLDAPGELARV